MRGLASPPTLDTRDQRQWCQKHQCFMICSDIQPLLRPPTRESERGMACKTWTSLFKEDHQQHILPGLPNPCQTAEDLVDRAWILTACDLKNAGFYCVRLCIGEGFIFLYLVAMLGELSI